MISLPSIPAPMGPATASAPVGPAPVGPGPVGLGLWQLGIEAQSLTAQIAALAEQLEAEDPLLAQTALGELESVLLQEEGNKQKLSDKADATCWVIDHLRAQANYRAAQAKRLADIAKADNTRADALETSLLYVLTRLQPEAKRFSFPNHEITSRKSIIVEITDLEKITAEWLVVKTTTTPDKNAIKDAIKKGTKVEGAAVINRTNWKIN
ncbi:MAG: hypothetical protein EBU08_16080 [Micrococcales bacterium]|nr:hypothetical protein [Micrococcales bacterium]